MQLMLLKQNNYKNFSLELNVSSLLFFWFSQICKYFYFYFSNLCI